MGRHRDWGYEREKLRTRFWHKLPKLLGKRTRYWVLVFEGARHIKGNEVVPEVGFMEVLKRSGDQLQEASR